MRAMQVEFLSYVAAAAFNQLVHNLLQHLLLKIEKNMFFFTQAIKIINF